MTGKQMIDTLVSETNISRSLLAGILGFTERTLTSMEPCTRSDLNENLNPMGKGSRLVRVYEAYERATAGGLDPKLFLNFLHEPIEIHPTDAEYDISLLTFLMFPEDAATVLTDFALTKWNSK